MAGYDFHRSGRPPLLAKNQRPSYGGGYTKWYFSAEPAATPVVIGDYSSPGSHEYPFYFAGTDEKLHKVQVSYASGPNTFSASQTYESSSTCSGNPIASPVLGETIYWNGSSYSSDRAIYVVDDDKKLYCFKESDGTIEARWGAQ